MSAMPRFAEAAPAAAPFAYSPTPSSPFDMESLGRQLHLFRRRVRPREQLFRAGQPMHALYLVHAGYFKLSVSSADGRERVTGFRMKGDLLGLDSLGSQLYACDAVALDTSEVWVLPVDQLDGLSAKVEGFGSSLTAALANEIRRDWSWMLSVGTLAAEQRVISFLLDLAERHRAMGFSAVQLMLRMTRAELGNFLSLQLETVTRALSHLAALGLISVDRREISILDERALRSAIRTPLRAR